MAEAGAMEFRRYTGVFGIAVALAALPFAVNFVFIKRAYEASSYANIVAEQLHRGGMYGSAFNGNDLKYKIELVRALKPDVVVIGSSRAMNVRGLVFGRPFVNAGGVSSNLLESETFVSEMLKAHVPKLALYFVDYWWFNAKSEQTSNRYLIDETEVSYAKLSSPFFWLHEGKISWDLYRDVILHGRHEPAFTSYDDLGLFTLRYSSGFRTDGSFFNARSLNREEGVVGYFWDELKRIENGTSERVNLGLGDFVSEENARRFLRILSGLKQSGVEVIVVLPPVAPLYLKAIRARERRPFVTALAERLRRDVPLLYDFTDFPLPVKADCEYADGYHAGDTLSLRLLRAILERSPDSPLRAYVNRDRMDALIARFAGRVLIVDQPEKFKAAEYDFLGLGCDKRAAEASR
ncbi:MAG TPA: hypothetical protein VFB08_15720 [Burkholderiales bacterium]|nr:hypothetical protein [Burkholderiales bacterium]